GIARVVRVLPRVAQVHVEVDGDHEPARVVVDAAPGLDLVVVGSSTIGRSGNTRCIDSTKIAHCCVPWKSSTMKNPPRSKYSRRRAASLSSNCQRPTSTA